VEEFVGDEALKAGRRSGAAESSCISVASVNLERIILYWLDEREHRIQMPQ
jgi:hypothetical protein